MNSKELRQAIKAIREDPNTHVPESNLLIAEILLDLEDKIAAIEEKLANMQRRFSAREGCLSEPRERFRARSLPSGPTIWECTDCESVICWDPVAFESFCPKCNPEKLEKNKNPKPPPYNPDLEIVTGIEDGQ
jgi:hypothetical protein